MLVPEVEAPTTGVAAKYPICVLSGCELCGYRNKCKMQELPRNRLTPKASMGSDKTKDTDRGYNR